MTLNAYSNRFRPVKPLNCVMSLNARDILTTLFPFLRDCILTKQHGIRGGIPLLNTPGNAITETLIFKISLDASALTVKLTKL